MKILLFFYNSDREKSILKLEEWKVGLEKNSTLSL